MPQFIIERNIDGASTLSADELADIATKSNDVVAGLGVPYRWITSYVAGDKFYCVHETDDAETMKNMCIALTGTTKRFRIFTAETRRRGSPGRACSC